MTSKLLPILILIGMLFAAGCGATETPPPTPTVYLVTATLPPTATAPPTVAPATPTPIPTLPPVEGTLTTQLNVRAEPSTSAASLGLLPIFSTVQILGRDVGGNWYQILYAAGPEGRGWLTAQYVQVADGTEIPVLGGEPGPGSAPNGAVTQQVNVRSGPGTDFNSLGTLNPQDGVTLTGKNSNGTWLQIEFANGPEGRGWLAAAYVQTSIAAVLPIVSEAGEVVGTGTPTGIPPTSTPTLMAAFDDGDSAGAPAVNLVFSPGGSRSLQYTSDLSSPQGDAEDWVGVTSHLPIVSVTLTCAGNGQARLELWQNGRALIDVPSLACGAEMLLTLESGQAYLFRLQALNGTGNLEAVRYTLFLSIVR
ncbi:MAG: SH3 domain-containing protein [Chloroflexi bacterium]|nr:SH3 domain-containing protein [Chloroflexota bacterium]